MSLPKLDAEEFSEFFSRLHNQINGREAQPFLWQQRLAQIVISRGWPKMLDLPTGSGKTAAIDIAIFHLALEAEAGDKRRAPMRIAFVVDRRIIVDAAYERSQRIAATLENALKSGERDGILSRVAARLAHLGGTKPLIARSLRGGVPSENDWAYTPCQPTVLCSTVDQVGSRLLFRGYGVTDSMKPVHAGLLGSDCLILLDEAHLSEPFRQTLAAVKDYGSPPWTERSGATWGFVTLSATPSVGEKNVQNSRCVDFSLTADERNDSRLAARLSASKPVRLVKAKSRTTQQPDYAREFAEHAWSLAGMAADDAVPKVVAVIVNRVALARRSHQEILSRISSAGVAAEAVLLIGRTREVDRAKLTKRLSPALVSGRPRPERTLFVVATQCIEAGADFDFDVMVTQLAPLDALRQRLGRLNRMGRPIPAQAVVMACADDISNRADDPLYEKRAKVTWDWLIEQASEESVDFGVNALDARLNGTNVSLLATRKRNGPVVMPAYIDLWAQTSPRPNADPEPALFLHGASDSADVQIIWRADIDSDELSSESNKERVATLLAAVPPRAAEAVSVPIRAARAWLSGKTEYPVSDVEGATSVDEYSGGNQTVAVFRWRGAENAQTGPVTPTEVSPGDVLIVSSSEGGCDLHGWNPETKEVVPDVADEATRPYAQRTFALRLHRKLLENELHQEHQSDTERVVQDIDGLWNRIRPVLLEAQDGCSALQTVESLLEVEGLPKSWRLALKGLAAVRNRKDVVTLFPYDSDDSKRTSGLVLIASRGIELEFIEENELDEATTDGDDAGSFRTVSVELADHSLHVESKAREFADRAGLTKELAQDVALAAFLHDEGKRDERFQLYLRRGDRLQAMMDRRVLAKSDRGISNRHLDALARRRALLPEKWRHEADSVRRALVHPRFPEARDPFLVLWLIGTHHGYGRPLYPHTDPDLSGPQDLDFQVERYDWCQVFSKLMREYGPWELARLEAIVRLADHRASEQEERSARRSETVPPLLEVHP